MSLERSAKIQCTAMKEQIEQSVFEAIRLSDADLKFLDVIIEQGGPKHLERAGCLPIFG